MNFNQYIFRISIYIKFTKQLCISDILQLNFYVPGIINKLDYIKELGVETIWLNPIYGSPLIDGGYDVSNHTDINPLFGNFLDFYTMIEEAHKRGMSLSYFIFLMTYMSMINLVIFTI